jgi:leucyl aminopeptidase (aminopeptidase T)
MEELERAVGAVVRDCLKVQSGEEVLVVANPATMELGVRLRAEAEAAGADALLTVMAERASHAAEPPASIAAAMKAADVVMAPTVQSLSHTTARKAASDAGVRIATLPGVTEEMLARVMSADIEQLRRRSRAVAERLDRASGARITCPRGSDLTLGLEGRSAIPDDGDLGEPAAFGNLPCGEGFIAPLEGQSSGTLVVGGTIATVGIPEEPTALTIAEGKLVAADGAAGEELLGLLTPHGPDATSVAELGIGTNEKATMTDNVLEAEKILGTVHVAFGASAGIGGTIQVPVHLDCVVTEPDVELDGETIVRGGEILV